MGFLISWFLGFLMIAISAIMLWLMFKIGFFILDKVNPTIGILISFAMASFILTVVTYFGL